MISIKKINYLLFSFLFFSCPLYASTLYDDFDAFLDDPSVNIFLDENQFVFSTKDLFNPKSTIDILEEMDILSLLQKDFYLRTNPINTRSVLDLPITLFDKDYDGDKVFGVDLFFNKTDRMYFSRHGDSISSYLAIKSDDLLESIDSVAKTIAAFQPNTFTFDPLDALSLFDNATIQERKVGALIHGQKTIRNINIGFKVPFYYLERNIWLTEAEQQEIEKKLGAATEEEQQRLQEEHLISDKLGFGDTRITIDFPATDSERFASRMGILATLPFGWAPAKGIIGSSFKDQRLGHNADFKEMTGYHLDELLTLATDKDKDQQAKAFTILKNLGYGALDHLAANLLDTPIGNNRHFGFGVLLKSKTELQAFLDKLKRLRGTIAENIVLKSFISLEYLFPAREERFFAETIDERLLSQLNTNIPDTTKAYDNMVFVESQIIDKLFPFVYETMVYHGIVFRWTSKATYESDRWGIHIGTDTWIKTPEKLCDIETSERQRGRLKIENARRLLAYQWKVLGSLFYKFEREDRTWLLSLHGDYSLATSGIGSDYTLSCALEVTF